MDELTYFGGIPRLRISHVIKQKELRLFRIMYRMQEEGDKRCRFLNHTWSVNLRVKKLLLLVMRVKG
jgi:hypothetical protein